MVACIAMALGQSTAYSCAALRPPLRDWARTRLTASHHRRWHGEGTRQRRNSHTRAAEKSLEAPCGRCLLTGGHCVTEAHSPKRGPMQELATRARRLRELIQLRACKWRQFSVSRRLPSSLLRSQRGERAQSHLSVCPPESPHTAVRPRRIRAASLGTRTRGLRSRRRRHRRIDPGCLHLRGDAGHRPPPSVTRRRATARGAAVTSACQIRMDLPAGRSTRSSRANRTCPRRDEARHLPSPLSGGRFSL